jgi:chromosome segregation ATPase
MCKKLLVAAVAIVVGLSVVKHTQLGSLLHVWWRDARTTMEKQIPPEVQIKQLHVEIDKIDRDIRKNLGKLADAEVDCQFLEKQVAILHADQKQLKEDILGLEKLLDSKTEKVVFNGLTYRTKELTRKLDFAVTQYNTRKSALKAKEQLLADKKLTLEAARERLNAMRDQKEQLRVIASRLETRVETLKLKAMEAKVDLDDSQVGKCNDLAGKIEERLAKQEMEAKLLADFGYRAATPALDREPKSTEEVLKAARKALQDDGDAVAAGDHK